MIKNNSRDNIIFCLDFNENMSNSSSYAFVMLQKFLFSYIIIFIFSMNACVVNDVPEESGSNALCLSLGNRGTNRNRSISISRLVKI